MFETGSRRYQGSSSGGARVNCKKRAGEEPKHISGRREQQVASAFAALDADANKQANWTRNVSSHNVPCASTSGPAHSNAQDTITRNFHPSYDNRRQGINHRGSTYGQHPVSLRNPVYNHNTHLELLHPTTAPPQMNPWTAYVATHRRGGSFGMTGVSHLPSNMRYQFHHPYASAASSADPWTEKSQLWRRPDYDEHGPRQFQRFGRP